MLSNCDHDRRARQDLSDEDRFRYENGLMSRGELRDLEQTYSFQDEQERFRQEQEEGYRQEEERNRKNTGGSSYSGGSSGGSSYSGGSYRSSSGDLSDIRNAAAFINDKDIPQSLRDAAKKKVRRYLQANEGKDKNLDKYLKEELHKSSAFSGWVVPIVIGILIAIFFFQ